MPYKIAYDMKRSKPRCYISGPIGTSTDYMDRFAKAEQELRLRLPADVEIINPTTYTALLPGGTDYTHEEYMSICMGLLDICDSIYLLKGWQDSPGCRAELRHIIDEVPSADIILQGE